MISRTIQWVSFLIMGAIVLLALLSGWAFLRRSEAISPPEIIVQKKELPKGSFVQESETYDAIGEPLLRLRFAPLTIRLPDLRRFLVNYGQNQRPDADPAKAKLHFSFVGSKEMAAAAPGERLYLLYSPSQGRANYMFSPDNRPTSLWLEAIPKEGEVAVELAMQNSLGELVRQPAEHAQFTLREQEALRSAAAPWEIGKIRVDATLLSRQKARWYGKDLFLEHHGGEEFAHLIDKQRIDFEDEEDKPYSVYVGLEDALVWKDERWHEAKPSQETVGLPMMIIKKIEDRLMKLDLWDPKGQNKVTLNLLKATKPWSAQLIERSFKFVGARTRSQFLFEINKERVSISPQDWLLQIDDTWKKLITPEQIDDYVDLHTLGTLFVVGEVVKKGDKQVLTGTLYSPTRIQMETIELPIQQGASLSKEKERIKVLQDGDDDEDDDRDDLDDD